MPTTLYPIEYNITLETGEQLKVAEFDPDRIESLNDETVMALIEPVAKLCTRMPRLVLESAKMGHSREFESLMRTPPVGCLLKLETPTCGLINDCVMADSNECTTRNILPKRKVSIGKFPVCWEMEITNNDYSRSTVFAKDLSACIVLAWKSNQWAIIVDDSS